MTDAIDILLQDKPGAERLLVFHRTNRTFLPRLVAEFRWLKKQGRKAGGAQSLFHYLRWSDDWHGEVDQNLAALAIRVCIIVWPDINGMVKLTRCGADKILSTKIRRRKGYGSRLVWPALDISSVALPAVWEIERAPSFHVPISANDADKIEADFNRIVSASPNRQDSVLRSWLAHVKAQPEVFVLMERTLLTRNPAAFSARGLVEYARWSIRRAAESAKAFHLYNGFAGLYCRALIIRNPEFNGRCQFKRDSEGLIKPGRANRLLGTSLAAQPINGEPYRRLIRNEVSV